MKPPDEFVSGSLTVNRYAMATLVFPIIKALFYDDGSERHSVIGTGFFISDRRFLSARHVFRDRGGALDQEDASSIAVYCVHAVDLDGTMVARPVDITTLKSRADTDIVTGLVETRQIFKANPAVSDDQLRHTAFASRVSVEPIPVGTRIFTVACPLVTTTSTGPNQLTIEARSDAFEGVVTAHHPEGRDRAMLPWPVYETSMPIRPGSSGGPVMLSGSGGTIFAVNCSSFDAVSVSHVTSLAPLVGAAARESG